MLTLDQRNTFLETSDKINTPVNLQGIKVGFTVFLRHKTGIGAYQVRNSRAHIIRTNGAAVDINFTFSYFTAFYEYYFIHTKRWDIGIPFEAGLGKYKRIDTVSAKQGYVVPMGAALEVRYKPMRWFSLNTMGGYRFVGNNNSNVKLSNWFYSFGFSIVTRHIYEDARYYMKKRTCKREIARITGE